MLTKVGTELLFSTRVVTFSVQAPEFDAAIRALVPERSRTIGRRRRGCSAS
jgi:hypothetical protein